ncbi:MAG TPA: FkbM family methyltransferase [Vicinamibacterales bacterium]|nr:FkbM family methyltransferase [Vicinamibacterales bacterium]
MSAFFGRRLLRRLLPKPLALRLRQEWLARRIAAGGGHLESEIHLLPALIKSSDVCWDIGANAGMYAVAMAKLAREVIAFEPVPHNFSTLRQAVHLAGLSNVRLETIALSDSAGHARFSVPVDQGFYGGFYMAAFHEQGEFEVVTDTIDHLVVRGFPEPDFIKCDVEGAEIRVIEGARGVIARRKPVWLLETFDADVLRRMRSLGYAAHVRTGENTLVAVDGLREGYRNYILS